MKPENVPNPVDISVIVPVFNEQENIETFHRETVEVLSGLGRSWEIVYVDDGSTDRSPEILRGLADDSRVRILRFMRNFGQTAAISAAIRNSSGDIIIPMDADLQNDPHDIPAFLAKIEEGYDVVSGWRRDRKDRLITRRIPSQIANRLISMIGGVRLHDYGCSMKAYRREVIRHVRLYGEMHRFIPLYAHQVGARIAEIPVNHRPRVAGKSKYGLNRVLKVLLDLVTAKFIGSYLNKPIYFFGSAGILLELAGVFFGLFSLYDRYFINVYIHKNPKILLAIFLFILGFLFIMLGILAELLMRVYYESQEKEPYFIRERINF